MKICLLRVVLSFSLCLYVINSTAQQSAISNSIDLYAEVEKLGFIGRVLYVAAHPDDENTRLISYFANHVKAETAYISLTRGGGGQNLIGTEIGAKLGLIRTHELVEARKIDGGRQFFSRAVDFGFSKHPDETFVIWNKEEVLKDLIKVIREFKPDIIINRFDHRSPGTTHGHHTGSAILSHEAFDLAADPSYGDHESFPAPWQAKRLFFNTSWWFFGSREKFEAADKTNLFAIDAGVHYSDKGYSNGEIAAWSRSMHKSQGFGSAGSRGSETDYLEFLKGDKPAERNNLFEGINTRWTRVPNGQEVAARIDHLLLTFDFKNPANNIPALVKIYNAILKTEDSPWKEDKREHIKNIIANSAGLYLEATASGKYATPGDSISITIDLVNRSNTSIGLKELTINGQINSRGNIPSLANNERQLITIPFIIANNHPISNPYWLENRAYTSMHKVDDYGLVGSPINESSFKLGFTLDIEGVEICLERDLIYKYTDPVEGEVFLPFYVFPRASIGFTEPVFVFADNQTKDAVVELEAFDEGFTGTLSLDHADGWKVHPSAINIDPMLKGEKRLYSFTISPPAENASSKITAVVTDHLNNRFSRKLTQITYDHIPNPIILEPAEASFERLDVAKQGKRIAYIMGAGDVVPAALRQISYIVDEINEDQLTLENLQKYDALIAGVRAYNTLEGLKLKKAVILDYVSRGGNYIVQYNTNRGVRGVDFSPYKLTLSNQRVTDENAEVSFLIPDHPVLNTPNKINSRDFENWVQERGLYFADDWGPEFVTPLAMNDVNEPPRHGSLLIAQHGKGHIIYTGLAWFRQLPAGVPGAYRLFANLISLKQSDTPQNPQNGINNED